MSDIFIPLGKHIRNTRNGFSPVCTEGSSLTAVLGLECLNRDTNLSFDNLKYTDLDISQELDCFVKNNDFFISRGNTTDLVALASIANLSDDSYPLIYPDIMIRIDFDSSVNIRYMAYIFNSFIGRLYFKYAAKGKNQTMVKTSAKEINDFFVPFPSLDEQKLIVDEITEEIRIQDTIKTQIEDWHLQIDTVIEKTLSANVIV
jgi:type I restriction enzyme S subunit